MATDSSITGHSLVVEVKCEFLLCSPRHSARPNRRICFVSLSVVYLRTFSTMYFERKVTAGSILKVVSFYSGKFLICANLEHIWSRSDCVYTHKVGGIIDPGQLRSVFPCFFLFFYGIRTVGMANLMPHSQALSIKITNIKLLCHYTSCQPTSLLYLGTEYNYFNNQSAAGVCCCLSVAACEMLC